MKSRYTANQNKETFGSIYLVHLASKPKPRKNPFKFGNSEIMTEESRKFDRSGKTQRKRKLKQDLEQYKEEDVKEAIRKGKTLISYMSTET